MRARARALGAPGDLTRSLGSELSICCCNMLHPFEHGSRCTGQSAGVISHLRRRHAEGGTRADSQIYICALGIHLNLGEFVRFQNKFWHKMLGANSTTGAGAGTIAVPAPVPVPVPVIYTN